MSPSVLLLTHFYPESINELLHIVRLKRRYPRASLTVTLPGRTWHSGVSTYTC